MNVHAALALTIDPERDSSDILSQWISENSLPTELKSLLEKSPELVLRLRYLDAWRVLKNQTWMPSENWFRDDNFVPGACAKIANTVIDEGMDELVRSERALATAMARSQFEEAESLPICEHSEFIVESYRWALRFAEWTERTWDALLNHAPLSRDECKVLLEQRLRDEPLPPLSVMD